MTAAASARLDRLPVLIAAATSAAALAVALLPAPGGAAAGLMSAAALAIFAIGLWATGVVGGHIVAIWFFLLAMLFGVAPAQVIFSGFHSTALWLIFGGLIVGVAVRETGLGARVAGLLAERFGRSYGGIVAGVVVVSMVLAFLIPSALGRIILLTPIVQALALRYGFEHGSRGYAGIMLAMAFGAMFPAFAILPANIPNLILAGGSEALYGIVPIYGEYLLLHYPVLGLLKGGVIIVLVTVLFRDEPKPPRAARDRKPMSQAERRLAIILVASLALWATDFLHHISPAWIALGAGALCLLPGMKMLEPSIFNEKINYGSLFYVAGILGLAGMIADTGLGDELGRFLLELAGFVEGQTVRNYGALVGLTAGLGLMTTQPGIPAVLTPLGGAIAEATNWPIATVLMLQVVGFSSVILPYQAPPLIVAIQLTSVRIADAMRLTVALFVVTVAVLIPLDFLWLRLLGYLP